jgi:spoIIIJ-associated protein
MSRTPGARRYFWGNSLRQALSRAARHFALAPEELDYRPVDKRHGFVKQPRRVLIEVDPASPRRSAGTASAALPGSPVAPTAPAPGRGRGAAARQVERRSPTPSDVAPPRAEGSTRRSPTLSARAPAEAPVAPDAESAMAASVALAKLLRFAGLELEAAIEPLADRLEIRLHGAGEGRLRELGAGVLDDLGYLLPRLVKSLSGKTVLCRIDGAGLRDAREEELRTLARAAGERVLASGAPELLDPLPPAERRIVHLTLADDPRLTTESLGHGVEKRLRIALAEPGEAPRRP